MCIRTERLDCMCLDMVTAVAANHFGLFQFNQMELECFAFIWTLWTDHKNIGKLLLLSDSPPI